MARKFYLKEVPQSQEYSLCFQKTTKLWKMVAHRWPEREREKKKEHEEEEEELTWFRD